MNVIDDITISTDFRGLAHALADRVAPARLVASPRWRTFADGFWLSDRLVDDIEATALVIGPPAAILRHAATASADFGFIMPVAQSSRWWQRLPSWRDDATLDLWNAGWSPTAIDRLLIPTPQAVIEFVIGDARRTPAVATDPNL